MSECFTTKQNFLLLPFDCKTNIVVTTEHFEITSELQKISFNVNPCIFDDLNNFIETAKAYYLLRDLKQYRPHRKPIPTSEITEPALLKNKVICHKRRLLVRDWFFFVVWSIRLKKILKSVYDRSQPIFSIDPKFKDLIRKCLNPQVSTQKFKHMVEDADTSFQNKFTSLKLAISVVVIEVKISQTADAVTYFMFETGG